jgi:D-erythronate 2-dehydrogenase
MSNKARHVIVTGAGGFIGQRLADALLRDVRFQDVRLTLVDLVLAGRAANSRVRQLQGDISDSAVRAEAIDTGADLVFHLAGVLGGAAEANYPLSRRINVDATLSLFEELRCDASPPRVIFASSIAVFGTAMPQIIDDQTMPSPSMVYGAQKLMMEVALPQFSLRGWIDGLAIRLPGIVARPGADARLKSAFLNNIFFAFAKGQDFAMPVSPEGTTWLISVSNCVSAFLHAGSLAPGLLGDRRAFTLPAQRVTIGELVSELGHAFPASSTRVEFRPDPALQAQFASQPPLTTAIADQLGFKHDGSLQALVAQALAPS